jgi:hypothetical protein
VPLPPPQLTRTKADRAHNDADQTLRGDSMADCSPKKLRTFG